MLDKARQGYHDKVARTLVMLEKFYQERRPLTPIPIGARSIHP